MGGGAWSGVLTSSNWQSAGTKSTVQKGSSATPKHVAVGGAVGCRVTCPTATRGHPPTTRRRARLSVVGVDVAMVSTLALDNVRCIPHTHACMLTHPFAKPTKRLSTHVSEQVACGPRRCRDPSDSTVWRIAVTRQRRNCRRPARLVSNHWCTLTVQRAHAAARTVALDQRGSGPLYVSPQRAGQ